jgi:RNA polymerase sigma-70 factor (ECF subfamily)
MNSDEAGYNQDLVLRAAAGEPRAFDALVLAARPKLRAVIRRIVGHPDDTDDLMQESIARAWQSIGTFRGDATFSTWLCAIGVRQALDHLRKQKAWRVEAQIVYSNECAASADLQREVMSVLADPAFVFEAGEHIAYCFQCVGRSLPPEQQAVLVLREVLGQTSREAAAALRVTEPVLRHQLGAARESMQQRFEGLCSLVGKQGVCYQCKGLREATPTERRGRETPPVRTWDDRVGVVRLADIDAGASQAMHDLFWRRTKELEDSGGGSPVPKTECGRSP